MLSGKSGVWRGTDRKRFDASEVKFSWVISTLQMGIQTKLLVMNDDASNSISPEV